MKTDNSTSVPVWTNNVEMLTQEVSIFLLTLYFVSTHTNCV